MSGLLLPSTDGLLLIQLCSAQQEEEPPPSAGEEAVPGDAGETIDAVLAELPSMPRATVITPTPPEAEAEAGLCRFCFAQASSSR